MKNLKTKDLILIKDLLDGFNFEWLKQSCKEAVRNFLVHTILDKIAESISKTDDGSTKEHTYMFTKEFDSDELDGEEQDDVRFLCMILIVEGRVDTIRLYSITGMSYVRDQFLKEEQINNKMIEMII